MVWVGASLLWVVAGGLRSVVIVFVPSVAESTTGVEADAPPESESELIHPAMIGKALRTPRIVDRLVTSNILFIPYSLCGYARLKGFGESLNSVGIERQIKGLEAGDCGMFMSEISRFTERAVTLAQNAIGGRDESAASDGGGGFADYAVVSLHCLGCTSKRRTASHLIC